MNPEEKTALYEKNKQAKRKKLVFEHIGQLDDVLQKKIAKVIIYADGREFHNSSLKEALKDLATILGYDVKEK